MRLKLAGILGLAGGWAVVTEFQAGDTRDLHRPAGDRVRARDAEERVVGPVIIRIAVGVALAAVPLLRLQRAGVRIAASHRATRAKKDLQELQTGFFGITYPSLWTVRELLFGSVSRPAAAVAADGGRAGRPGAARTDKCRGGPALVAAAIGLYYLLLNASYFYWEGGWAFGPRQMTTALPFLGARSGAAVGSRRAWPDAALLLAGWIWGVASRSSACPTTPQPPASFKAPMRELLWPAFRDGDLR